MNYIIHKYDDTNQLFLRFCLKQISYVTDVKWETIALIAYGMQE